ncbi:hypothetical protein CPC16_001440 [Podila verticillata]|uniref:Major facilitator superfamily (MFS) profile domain-containing protein n=1 Tax=Podila verticillata NRRL 6337 TaxID=1069443 RepID=A0A086TJP9_9FUNG|nr:hypothetical protein BGZ59_010353 [Podila verticillata]KAF9374183.1 hypothetical protein CPC16_001440 [Podila verticillata]KFH62176.1 hypothetical protein MVEG_11815 [Podila verticillata NRRL 6337]
MSHTSEKSSRPWHQQLTAYKGVLLAVVSMAQLLDILNVSSVTIVLPSVMRDVGFKFDQLQWVSSAYALAYGAFLLLGGRIGDLFGHRNIFLFGVIWFSIWSVVNGFAKTPVVMSIGRALQGMGAGFTVPSALAILTTTYPVGPERTKALGIFGGTAAFGSILGMLLGGILGSTIGWRWMFYITGIIGFALSILGFLAIPPTVETRIIDRRVDVAGITTFTAGVVTFIYYLSEGPSAGWGSAKTLAPFIVGLVLLAVFVIIQFKITYPIMPLHIWRSRRLVASCASAACMMAALNSHFFFTSLVFQNILGYTPLKTSLCYIPHGVGVVLTIGFISKVVVQRVRSKIIIAVGWVFLIASGVVWAQTKVTSSYWALPFPALLLNMAATSCIWFCCQMNSVADAADEDQGVVGAVYNVCLQVGAPIGIAIANIIADKHNKGIVAGPELMIGYRDAMYSFAAMAGLGLICTLLLNPNQDIVVGTSEDNDTESVASQGKDEVSTIG